MNRDTKLLLSRGVRRGLRTLLRERSWGSGFGALLGIVILVQLLLLGGLALDGVATLLRSRTDLLLELQEGVADTEVRELFAQVKAFPFVQEATYITRDQAYETVRRRNPEFVTFLEQYEIENPFNDTIAVTLRQLSDYEAFATFIQNERWSAVVDPSFLSKQTDQEAQIYEMIRLMDAGSSLVLIVLVLTVGILLFILMELVRKRALGRSEEILVERMSGARTLSILVPFVVEAAMLLLASLVGGALAISLFLFLLPSFVPALHADGAFGAVRAEVLLLLRTSIPWILLSELLIIPVVAFLGAWIGIKPQVSMRKLKLV